MNSLRVAAFIMFAAMGLAACASAGDDYNKPGFVTEVKDSRLWVFRANSKELAEFKQHGELKTMVTRIGEGPKGMTIRAADAQTIDDYMKTK